MKYSGCFLIIFTLSIFACKTPTPPQSLTIDGVSLTLPEGFKPNFEGIQMSLGGMKAVQNTYQKIEGGNTATLKMTRFDIAHIGKEDPDYLTELCLGEYRTFNQEGQEDTYKCSENTPLSIDDKNGQILTFDVTTDPQYPLKGEMIAVKSGTKIVVLHYTDFANHYEKGKADWESLKNSIKINQ